jgi:CheY-like chemotaxis protein
VALQQYAERLEQLVEERTRELVEASRVKDRILGMMSHELRAPLTPILAWAAILRRHPDPRRVRQAMEVIDRNVRLQITLVDDLLDAARMTDRSIVLDVKPVDLRAVVRAAVATVSDTAWQKGIRVDATIGSDAVVVDGDAGRLCQVVASLLWNGVKFTARHGRVAVTVARDDAQGRAIVTVRDNGAGIAPDFLPSVFQVFSQHEDSTRRQHGGLGVGLALAKHLTELHGGSIKAFSAGPGRGAEFTVQLPLARNGARTIAGGAVEPADALLNLAGTTLLLVDDMDDAVEATRALLETLGATVVVARDGLEALSLVDRHPPDVVLCDLRMPVMDGFEFIERLRANPSRIHLPVIAVTALARPGDYAHTRAAGFDGLLTKPFDDVSLASALRAVLNGRRLKQAC